MSEQIKETINNLLTQDNRCTDQPMFIVEQERVIGPFLEGYGDFTEWYNIEIDEYANSHMERRLDQRIEAGAWPEESYKGWRRYEMKKQWEFVTACFTEQGCKDYLERNGHNLGKTRIYAVGSTRNVEFQQVRKMLIDSQPEVSTDTTQALINALERIDVLEAKIERLTSRGIEDMRFRIKELEAENAIHEQCNADLVGENRKLREALATMLAITDYTTPEVGEAIRAAARAALNSEEQDHE